MINITKEEKLITKYLLGQATEEECVRIEESYFHKPEYYEQVLAIEEELITNYVRSSLSPTERSLFETHFLSSERRRKKYELTKDLVNYLSESYMPATDGLGSGKSLRKRFFSDIGGFTMGRMVGTVMAVMLVSIVGGVWISKRAPIPPTDVALLQMKEPTGNRSAEPKIASPEPISSSTTAQQTQPSPDLSEDTRLGDSIPHERPDSRRSATTSIPEFVIDLSGLRSLDEITEVKLPSRMSMIQLNLSLSESDYPSYGIIIKTLEGKEVLRRSNMKPRQTRDGRILALRIPSKVLRESDFVLDITGVDDSGNSKMLHESFFSVKRQ